MNGIKNSLFIADFPFPTNTSNSLSQFFIPFQTNPIFENNFLLLKPWTQPLARKFLGILVSLVLLLPNFLLLWIIQVTQNQSLGMSNLTLNHFLSPSTIQNALLMTHGELEQISDLNDSLLKREAHRLLYYYGASDDWCPLTHYLNMIQKTEGRSSIYLCNLGLPHAFVLKHGKTLARFLCSDGQDSPIPSSSIKSPK